MFGYKNGLRGSIFGEHVGRSKNVLTNIAIDQESLISNFGITKTPPETNNTFLQKKEKKYLTEDLTNLIFLHGMRTFSHKYKGMSCYT